MVYSYRSAMARIAVLCGLSAVQLAASSGRRSLSNGTRLMDWPCSIPMRPIGSSAPMSMDSAAQHMLARSLSRVCQSCPLHRQKQISP